MRYSKAIHWLAFSTAFVTFVSIIAGGLVTSTGSGLAEHTWPLGTGMSGTKFYENMHRIIGASVGLLTLILTIWIILQEIRRWIRWLAIAAFGAVVAQGLLGALTVKLELPPGVSIMHAGLAQGFFCLIVSLTVFTSNKCSMPSEAAVEPRLFRHALATAAHIYVQILLGAWLRHIPSGAALISHIVIAIIVGINVLSLSVKILENHGNISELKIPVYCMAIFFVAQLILGPLALLLSEGKVVVDIPKPILPSAIVTAHVGIGALLLASSLVLTLRIYRIKK